MAIWQFQCFIIPRRDKVEKISEDELISWKNKKIESYSINFLKDEKSWSKDIIQFGKLDETCLEFIYEDGKIEEINCRFDLRSLSKTVFLDIIEYVKKIDAMFFYEGKIYPPEEKKLVEIMKISSANSYCNSPFEYIISSGKK